MLAARLRARCPSAQVVGAARADGFDIAFDKIGQDGSAKATLVAAAGQAVPGALFHLDDAELAILDQIEGLGRGYDRQQISLRQGGQAADALTYIAPPEHRRAGILPFDWYLGLVLAGAYERALPPVWIQRLRAIATAPDPEANRPRQLEARALLNACPPEWRHADLATRRALRDMRMRRDWPATV